MPRYFFDVQDSESYPDTEGTEFPDGKGLRTEAFRKAIAILRDAPGALSNEEWTMNVRDNAGHQVLTLRFSATEN